MLNNKIYEIFVRKGKDGGPYVVKDQQTITMLGEMLAIAKKLVDDKEVDEAVVLEKRVVKRFVRYDGEG